MMRVELKWEKSNRWDEFKLEPRCHSYFIGDYIYYSNKRIKYFFNEIPNQENSNYKGYLNVLLIDTGGDEYLNKLSWIEEGIEKIEKILNNSSNQENWGGEGFEAEIRKEGVLIYFLIDDNYFDIIPLKCFYKSMVAWRKFLDTEPNEDTVMEIECEEE